MRKIFGVLKDYLEFTETVRERCKGGDVGVIICLSLDRPPSSLMGQSERGSSCWHHIPCRVRKIGRMKHVRERVPVSQQKIHESSLIHSSILITYSYPPFIGSKLV